MILLQMEKQADIHTCGKDCSAASSAAMSAIACARQAAPCNPSYSPSATSSLQRSATCNQILGADHQAQAPTSCLRHMSVVKPR